MKTLFEYGEWVKVQNKDQLKQLLKTIWVDRHIEGGDEELQEGIDSKYQPFLQFDDDTIRANNYIGFIQNDNELLEIYPKVFRHLEDPDKNLMLQHIFYWFSYCRKWRFPFNRASLDNSEIDKFPELIIYLIANQFLETVSNHPLMQYQQIEETLTVPKGSLNFNRYINRGLVNGNYHLIECDYEPFVFDNKVNRAIKYCTRLLMDQTKFSENQRLLQEIVFILDEVEDTPISINDVNTTKFNNFYTDYTMVLEMCKTILNQQIYSSRSYDMSQWCLLFPMEYIFEDFLAGFLETHFSDHWKVEYQKSDEYLSTNPIAFNLQHDIFLTSRDGTNRKIIVDTKYKLRDLTEGDKKAGVSQSDLYQVVSYGYRRGCKEVILIYPNQGEELNQPISFEVQSGFEGKEIINVKVCEIPFWSMIEYNSVANNLKMKLSKILRFP